MNALRPWLHGIVGLAGGLGLALVAAACCSESKRIVWNVAAGSYHLDNRLVTDYAHDALILDNAHGDLDFRIVVSADGTRAVETFQRNRRKYVTTYAMGQGDDVVMRSDTSVANERIGD